MEKSLKTSSQNLCAAISSIPKGRSLYNVFDATEVEEALHFNETQLMVTSWGRIVHFRSSTKACYGKEVCDLVGVVGLARRCKPVPLEILLNIKFITHVVVAVPAVALILIKKSLKVFYPYWSLLRHACGTPPSGPDTACLVVNHNKTAIHVD